MPTPTASEARLRYLLHLVIILTVGTVLAGLAADLVWTHTPPVNYDAAFRARTTIPIYSFYAWQPGKYRGYVAACVVGAGGLLLGHALARRLLPKFSFGAVRLALIAIAAILFLFFAASLVPLWVCPAPALPRMPPSYLRFGWYFEQYPVRWAWSMPVCLGLAAVSAGLTWWRGPRVPAAAFGAVIVLELLFAPMRFYAPNDVDESVAIIYHFITLSEPLSQVINGHHLGIDFPHLYGGYVEFVAPLLRPLPRTLETMLLVFPLISCVAYFILLWAAARVIRQPALLFVASLAVLGAQAMLTMEDHYYNYQAVRVIGPALVLFGAAGYFRRPGWSGAAATSILAVLASLWNSDTGVIAWASWTAAYAVEGWVQGGGLRALAGRAAACIAALGAGALAFVFYLRLVGGAWPNPALFFRSQQAMVEKGYFCVRLIYPSAWDIAILTSAIGLALATLLILTGRATWRTHWLLMLSLLSIGTFGYYLGRSAESNLVQVIFPFLILAALLADETIVLVRQKVLPRVTWVFLVPSLVMLAWVALLSAVSLPATVQRGVQEMSLWHARKPTAVEIEAAFISAHARPGESAFIFSRQNGFLYYLTGVVSPVRMAGIVELFFTADFDPLLDAINHETIPKLFVDDDVYHTPLYKPGVMDRVGSAIAQHYRVVATDATGRVTYLTPLSSSP